MCTILANNRAVAVSPCSRYNAKYGYILFVKAENGALSKFYLRDDSIEEFENKIKRIYEYIFGYCPIRFLDENKNYFYQKVHEGFGLAQNHIIQEILEIESSKNKFKKELKEANKDRNKNLINKIRHCIVDLTYRECILRKLADSIAWHFIQHHSTARRLYIGKNPNPISHTNLESTWDFSKKINQCEMSFALLTDITSFIQISDMILVNINSDDSISWDLIELKEGKVNWEIQKFIEKLGDEDADEDELLQFLNPKEIDQIERQFRQANRMIKAKSIINEGSGIDEAGTFVKILDNPIELEIYMDNIENMLLDCENNGFSLDVIDNCLYIAAYSMEIPLRKAYEAFSSWMAELNVEYPIINFQSTFCCPLSDPIFNFNLKKEDVIDIALGKKLILACLDYDELINIGEEIGLVCEWEKKKESGSTANKYGILDYNNKILKVSLEDRFFHLGDGWMVRIFYEFLKPTSALRVKRRRRTPLQAGGACEAPPHEVDTKSI